MANYPVTITIAPNSVVRSHTFGIGVMRWGLRVEAYLLLLVDDYPPLTLD